MILELTLRLEKYPVAWLFNLYAGRVFDIALLLEINVNTTTINNIQYADNDVVSANDAGNLKKNI